MELFPVYPLNEIKIVRAEGARVFDEQGRSYLDFYGGHAVISIGHQHPHWKRRIEDQLSKIAFYSNSVKLPIQEELARTMGKITGKEQFQLFLCNSGAEANENAMKLASFHTGRKKIIAFKKSFHGRTSLAVAATDNPAIIAPVNETQNVDFLPFNDPHSLEDHFAKNPSSIAAVILEGIQGVGGIHVATSEFIKAVRKLCDQYGAVYIADSVQCGYGRSGHFFSHDHAGVEADLYTMAKGMGNGFPIGGVLIHPKFKAKPGMLGTTFGGNPLACAAALAVLEVLEKDRLVSQAVEKGHYLMQQLSTIPGLLRIRGMGLMIGFDLPESRREARRQLLDEFRIFTGEAKPHTIRLLPALTISKTEMDELIEALRKVMGTGAY
jgi:acetylornithine/N-succinyldiaminopimelate aminotransferase